MKKSKSILQPDRANVLPLPSLLLILLAALISAPCAAMQPNGCEDYVEPTISVKQLVTRPAYNDTLDLSGIRRLALEGSRTIASGSHQTPVGLTAASLTLDSRFQVSVRKRGDDPLVCAQITDFELNFGFNDTTIYIARDIPTGTCAHRVVLDHEMRHVQTDSSLVQSYTPVLRNLLRDALQSLGTLRASSADAAEEQIRYSINRYMSDLGKSISEVRQRYQMQIDTPEEYKRLSQSCDYELARMIKQPLMTQESNEPYTSPPDMPTGGGYYGHDR